MPTSNLTGTRVQETSFCDCCGNPLPHLGRNIDDPPRIVYASMPIDMGSIYAGESAVICSECDSNIPDNYSK